MSKLYINGNESSKEITSLVIVHPNATNIVHRVGERGVASISYSAGTSGVEYQVHKKDGMTIQYRGNHSYMAEWE